MMQYPVQEGEEAMAVIAAVAKAKVDMGTECKLPQEGAGSTITTQEPRNKSTRVGH